MGCVDVLLRRETSRRPCVMMRAVLVRVRVGRGRISEFRVGDVGLRNCVRRVVERRRRAGGAWEGFILFVHVVGDGGLRLVVDIVFTDAAGDVGGGLVVAGPDDLVVVGEGNSLVGDWVRHV